MPVPNLNAVNVQDQYVDALTVQFPFARPAFTVIVSNAAILYQVAVLGPAGREPVYEPIEHRLDPSFSSFTDPSHEGFPPGSQFAGIRVRNAVSSQTAIVSVN